MSYKRTVQQDLAIWYLRFADAGTTSSAKNEGLISGHGNSGSYNAGYTGVNLANRAPSLVGDPTDYAWKSNASGQLVALNLNLSGFQDGWQMTGNGGAGGHTFAISMWIKTTSSTAGILFKGNVTAGQGSMLQMDAAGKLYWSSNTGNNVYSHSAVTTTSVNDGNVHFIVVNFTQNIATEIWVDAVREVNVVQGGWLAETTSISTIQIVPTWVGEVDEFALYVNPLTPQQIRRQNTEGRTPQSGVTPGRFVVPGYEKFSVDRDGSLYYVTTTAGTLVRAISASEIKELIDDDDTLAFHMSTNTSGDYLLKYVFPEPRDIYAIIGHVYADGHIYYSTNATNLNDGGWGPVGSYTFLAPPAPGNSAATLTYQVYNGGTVSGPALTNLYDSSNWRVFRYPIMGVRGIAMKLLSGHNSNGNWFVGSFQIYGKPSSGLSNRVVLWDPVIDAPLAGLDFGDLVRGSVRDVTFRLKNISSFSANSIVLSSEALTQTLSGPGLETMFTFSDPGTTSAFATTKTITSLSAGAISGVITYRANIDVSAGYGSYMPRINVTVGSFT